MSAQFAFAALLVFLALVLYLAAADVVIRAWFE